MHHVTPFACIWCRDGRGSDHEDEVTISCSDGTSVSFPVPPPDEPPMPGVLAVAYINDDGIDGYLEGADTLIEGLFDSNEDGVPSAGDEIRTGQYPLDVDATDRGSFGVATHTADVAVGNATSVTAFVGGAAFSWVNSGDFESYEEGTVPESCSDANTTIIDDWSLSSDDGVCAGVLSPSQPNTPADDVLLRPGDDAFIDVDILS